MEFLLDYEQQYWDALMNLIGNEIGVAALMGNFYAESNIIPYRLQGDYLSDGEYKESISYTNAVDNGSYAEATFVNDSKGYGVAQWTFYARKQNIYHIHKDTGHSIGSFEVSMQMISFELNGGYASTMDVLQHATDIRTASDYVLHNYEQPADQSTEVEVERAGYAQQIYDKYAGGGPGPGPEPGTAGRKLPIYLYVRRRDI